MATVGLGHKDTGQDPEQGGKWFRLACSLGLGKFGLYSQEQTSFLLYCPELSFSGVNRSTFRPISSPLALASCSDWLAGKVAYSEALTAESFHADSLDDVKI